MKYFCTLPEVYALICNFWLLSSCAMICHYCTCNHFAYGQQWQLFDSNKLMTTTTTLVSMRYLANNFRMRIKCPLDTDLRKNKRYNCVNVLVDVLGTWRSSGSASSAFREFSIGAAVELFCTTFTRTTCNWTIDAKNRMKPKVENGMQKQGRKSSSHWDHSTSKIVWMFPFDFLAPPLLNNLWPCMRERPIERKKVKDSIATAAKQKEKHQGEIALV